MATAPVTTSAAQRGKPSHTTALRIAAEPTGGPEAGLVAPRLDRHHDGEGDDHECEQKVGHDGERVEVEDDRHAAEGDLREPAQERAERGGANMPRQLRRLARGEPRHEREEDADCSDDAVAELDERVEPLLRVGRIAAARPVLTAETGAREPDERTGRDDDEHRPQGDRREPQKALRRHAVEQGVGEIVTVPPESIGPRGALSAKPS